MKKSDLPSTAQAKLLAVLWGTGKPLNICKHWPVGRIPYVPPTHAALIKRGWIDPSGAMPFTENGFEFEPNAITDDGQLALECFLQNLRQSGVSHA